MKINLIFTFLILSALLLYWPILAVGETSEDYQKHTKGKQQYAENANYRSDKLMIPIYRNVNAKEAQKDPDNGTQKHNDDKEGTNLWIIRATIVIARATIAQVIAMILQYCAMNKQVRRLKETVKATKQAAKAAHLNAQAAIDAQRAWIGISVEYIAHNQFSFGATNVGRTPAKIISIYRSTVRVQRNEKLQIPQEYWQEEGNTPNIHPTLLPPTVRREVFQWKIVDLHGEFRVDEWMRYLKDGIYTVYFLGRIVYSIPLEGTAGTPHETTWLYMYIPKEGALPIPDPMHPEYNNCT